MAHVHWLQTFFILVFAIVYSYCQCDSDMCEKISLSLGSNTKRNYSLGGCVLQTFTFTNWQECFHNCLANCQCLSFNFNEVNATENCELNDANTKVAPEALKEKEGVNYYEPVRNYYDKKGVVKQTCSGPTCHNNCCDTLPCQNGGTCYEICDATKRRFACSCPPGFGGYRCQLPRSCKEIVMINNVTTDGTYNIVDKKDIPFPVYCDFGPEPGFVWTLIQSHSLNNNRVFRNRSFYFYNMYVNQNNPESWNFYRLSMGRMKSIRDASTHWRATCNFPTDGVDYRDYVRSSHVSDLFAAPDMVSKCRFFEYVNIRGFSCINCTAFTAYGKSLHFHMDSSDDVSKFNCDFNGTQGAVHSEDNFGYYAVTNPAFRCSSSRKSTTQYWLGSYYKRVLMGLTVN